MTAPAVCESCGTELVFARTRGGKNMPLNRVPDDTGNVAAYQDELGIWHARVLGKNADPLGYEKRMMPHFATCTAPEAHRRRQRGQWTAAVAARNADQRRRRTRPAQPGYLPGMNRLPGGQP